MPKGMKDYYPEEKAVREKMYATFKARAKAYGFQEVEMPVMETIENLTAKSGPDKKSQIFVLEKRSNEQLGLRFDLTIPMTRLFVAKQKELPKPVKWFCVDKNWRYEAPQKGRLREFYQFGVEVFGSESPRVDAEVINLVIDCMQAFGITEKDVVMKVNSRKLLEGLLQAFVPPKKMVEVIRAIDQAEGKEEGTLKQALKDIGVENDEIIKLASIKGTMQEVASQIENCDITEEGKEELEKMKQACALIPKEWVEVNLGLARGLDYYTGIVFEAFDKAGDLRALAGGGRYDALTTLLGGEDTPATGFGFGILPFSIYLEEKGLLPNTGFVIEYFVAPVDEAVVPEAFRIAEKLRKKFNVEVDLSGRKLGKQFEYAASIGAKKIIVVGSRDLEKGLVTVRDLAKGKEEQVKVDDLG
ncbi:MAG: histidine--tRNA ligase [Candidatus Woesearchaeota archaeon]|jgi:histidyl-tRNA synthetase|nr:histidine--tRNA ligase [Candidatus Woesearchaeota archaeon]MDP7181588.1 histidine--tRNA ligase [Candidatus Woesearchaeota archaeon]MDP7198630.1 histidine--tRNA ligase [Candidatus Woesearchaeota archaeon]MDP7466628.1 histidine--tRNA ligase [Candidatus Woesearchaeota archaeon]MDP7646884.1 histidine--tRNA ligase [Candidatus Woesearchaeota archaeon]